VRNRSTAAVLLGAVPAFRGDRRGTGLSAGRGWCGGETTTSILSTIGYTTSGYGPVAAIDPVA
jgi:hypothetical protein